VVDPLALIKFNSFDSVWYWLMVGVAWSLTCHWTLGVPFDSLIRAERKGGEFAKDVERIATAYVRRAVYMVEKAGIYILGALAFLFAVIGTFAFFYSYQFAQAIFAMALPLCFVQWLNIRLALKINRLALSGVELQRALLRRRFWNQVIGLLSILVASCFAFISLSRILVWL
jgi:hypothetical protein